MTNEAARLPTEETGPVATSGGRNSIIPRPEPEGLDRAIENAASDWWHSGAMLAIKQLALSGRGFTVDHIRDMAGEPEAPQYWGAVFASAQRQKIVEAVGARVGRDGRLVRVWWGLPT